MFQKETRKLEKQIVELLQDQDITVQDDLDWSPVPFSGEWGIATSFFKLAAQEAKSGRKGSVPERAEELAALVADKLPDLEYFPRVEAAGGYLNLYFDSRIFSSALLFPEARNSATDITHSKNHTERWAFMTKAPA